MLYVNDKTATSPTVKVSPWGLILDAHCCQRQRSYSHTLELKRKRKKEIAGKI